MVDTVRLVDMRGPWSVQRMVQFVEGVLAEEGIVELGTSFDDVKQ